MSVCMSFFCNSSKDLSELAQDINACLGCSLAPYENNPDDYFTRFLGMEFSLSQAEGYENDRDLDFESFRYELEFRTSVPDGDLRTIQLPALFMVVYLLHRRLGLTGMMVRDVQTVIVRYEEREKTRRERYLYDVLSETPFDDFLLHFSAVKRRLGETP
jgi:hypothetical protein